MEADGLRRVERSSVRTHDILSASDLSRIYGVGGVAAEEEWSIAGTQTTKRRVRKIENLSPNDRGSLGAGGKGKQVCRWRQRTDLGRALGSDKAGKWSESNAMEEGGEGRCLSAGTAGNSSGNGSM